MIISLILPVYNVDRFLEKCLISCFNQNIPLTEYEIIAVNDGSKDDSLQILNNFKSKYGNLKIINQKNQGLSVARNNGLKEAIGDFVWFIDSDDYIEENCLLGIVQKLQSIKPDLMHLNYQLVWLDKPENNAISCNLNVNYNNIYSGKEDLINLKFPYPAQFTIYKRSFLIKNQLFFYPNILHEDMEFKPRAVYLASEVIYYKPIIYNYLQARTGSITSYFSIKNALGLLKVIENLKLFKKDKVQDLKTIKSFNKIIALSFNRILDGFELLSHNDKKLIANILNYENNYFQDFIKTDRVKYKVEGFIFSINTKLGFYLYQLFYKVIKRLR